jgi:hypothetical protein
MAPDEKRFVSLGSLVLLFVLAVAAAIKYLSS